jgi:putative transposase
VRRGPYAKVTARNAALLVRIRTLKAEHPFWGYRRVWACLRYVDGLAVNQKRVWGTMKANGLLVKPNLKLRARRKAATTKPRPTRPAASHSSLAAPATSCLDLGLRLMRFPPRQRHRQRP